jgi:hypothetical protein
LIKKFDLLFVFILQAGHKMAAPTANAKGAKDGYDAERVLTTEPYLKLLSSYFKKPIAKNEVISGEKSDLVIRFVDGTKVLAQIKNFTSKMTSHQTNRRCLKNLPVEFQGIASHICLGNPKKSGTWNGKTRKEFLSPYVTPSKEQSKELANLVLLGNKPEWEPQYMILTLRTDGIIKKILIEPMSSFMAVVHAGIYDTPDLGHAPARWPPPLKTTLSICDEISIQRHGADETDSNPDDIQFKLSFNKKVMAKHNYVQLSLP